MGRAERTRESGEEKTWRKTSQAFSTLQTVVDALEERLVSPLTGRNFSSTFFLFLIDGIFFTWFRELLLNCYSCFLHFSSLFYQSYISQVFGQRILNFPSNFFFERETKSGETRFNFNLIEKNITISLVVITTPSWGTQLLKRDELEL